MLKPRSSLAILALGAAVAASMLTACSSAKHSSAAAGKSSCTSFSGTTPGAKTSPGVTSTSIKIGLLVTLTGPGANADAVMAAKAAFAQVNAAGGINGRKLDLVTADDGGSSTQALTATQSLVSQGVFGILDGSSFFFAAYRYAVQKGIPVSGQGVDGSEWGCAQNYNLFSGWGSFASNYPTYTTEGAYFKKYGATKLAVLAVSNVPAAQNDANATSASAKLAGVPTAYKNFSEPLGSTNYAADAVAIKKAGVDAISTYLTTTSNIALLAALKQEGVKIKAAYIAGGYDQAVLDNPTALAAVQGIPMQSQWQPSALNTPATKNFMAALKQYGGYTKPNPTAAVTLGWFPAQTFIAGLKAAGKKLTWGSFITGLRGVHDYTANGLIAPVDYAKFGNVDPTSAGNCFYLSVANGDQFTPLQTAPFCGTEVAGTHNGS